MIKAEDKMVKLLFYGKLQIFGMKSGVQSVWPRLKDKKMGGCDKKIRRKKGEKWRNKERREKRGTNGRRDYHQILIYYNT